MNPYVLAGSAIVLFALGRAGGGIATAGISRLAQAIAKAEGYGIPNAIPTRANNPGNLKAGAPTLPNSGGITQYPTPAAGWAALERQLSIIATGQSAHYTVSMTLAEMGAKWAPSGDNNIVGAWARNVASALGVPLSTRLESIL